MLRVVGRLPTTLCHLRVRAGVLQPLTEAVSESGRTYFGTRPIAGYLAPTKSCYRTAGSSFILLKNSVLTGVEKILALIGRADRFMLGAHKGTLVTRRKTFKRIYKREVDGIFEWIRIWQKFAVRAISSFSTE
jgi:hypothetical protein